MIEKKLYHAAQFMPTPESTFEEAVIRSHKNTASSRSHRLRPAIITLILVLVFTVGAGAHRYSQIQRGMWVIDRYSTLVMPTTSPWKNAQTLLKPFDYNLPQQLMGHDFESAYKYSVVPHDTPLYEAMFTRFYNPVSFNYSIIEYREDGINYDRLSNINVSMGSTTEEYWRHYFSLDDSNIWHLENMIPGTYRTIEYQGYVIQCGSKAHTDSETGEAFTIHWAIWIDETHQCCISISTAWTGSTDLLLQCAKELIDQNR